MQIYVAVLFDFNYHSDLLSENPLLNWDKERTIIKLPLIPVRSSSDLIPFFLLYRVIESLYLLDNSRFCFSICRVQGSIVLGLQGSVHAEVDHKSVCDLLAKAQQMNP